MKKIRIKFGWFVPFLIASLTIFVNQAIGETKEEVFSRVIRSPTETSEKDALKDWFSTMLGINDEPNQNADVDGMRGKNVVDRARTPQYVQDLYDQMALSEQYEDDQVLTRRRRRSLNGASGSFENAANIDQGPVIVQAVTRDAISQNKTSNGNGYLLQYTMEKLWIPSSQLRVAELVLAVDFSRLNGPPNSYSVLCYLIDPSAGNSASRPRLFIGSSSIGSMDMFQNFVKMNVTEAIVRNLAGGHQTVTFEIFVTRVSAVGEGNGDLQQQEVGNLFHLSSHGAHQPLLVLHSTTATEVIRPEVGSATSKRRYRRVPRPSAARVVENLRGNQDGLCHLTEWWIDLEPLFRDQVIAPQGFYANFCDGRCQNPLLYGRWNATANAHLRSSYNVHWRNEQAKNGTNEPSYVPEPHCVPQSYSPITVLFKGQNSFVMKRLDKVIANACMCA